MSGLRIIVFLAAFLACYPLAPVWGQSEAPAKKTKILLIGHKRDHPFGTHMYLHECRLLAHCLEQTSGVETIVSDGWPEDPKISKNVNAIVFYSSPAGDILLKGPHAPQAEKLLNEGMVYTAIHWATGARGKELGEKYLQILGGWFDTSFAGLKITRAELKQAASRHPICRGWDEYKLREEFYLDLKFMSQTRPVLQVTVDDHKQTVAWAYKRPNSNGGRSFGTTLGHFHDNFKIKAFRKAVVNGILWTAHRKVPAQGAPVEVAPEQLNLQKKAEKK